jgi:hypothetical protein
MLRMRPPYHTKFHQQVNVNSADLSGVKKVSLVATARQVLRGTRAAIATIAVTLLALVVFPGESPGRELYFIDVHSQIDRQTHPDTVTALLEQGGVRETILS